MERDYNMMGSLWEKIALLTITFRLSLSFVSITYKHHIEMAGIGLPDLEISL